MNNPILQRELMTTLRSPRSSWTLIIMSGILVLLTCLLWPSAGRYSLSEQASHTLLNTISLGGLLIALLISPSFTATCLTSEKENASYDLLTHTLLRPWQIAWGKIVSAQLFLLILVLSLLPILATTLFLGGTSSYQVLLIIAMIACATITTGLLGFAVSAWSQESFTALVITYVITLGWTTLPLLAPLLTPHLVTLVPFLGTFTYSSPLSAVLSVIEPDLFLQWKLPVNPRQALPIFFGSSLMLASLGWLLGTLRILFSKQARSVHRSASYIPAKRLKFPYVLIDPRRRKRLIGNWTNAVLAKELRSKTFGQAPWLIRGMYATFTFSLVLVALMLMSANQRSATQDLDVLKLTMVAFQILVVVLLVPALLAGAVTQEIEQRQFDLLRQTLLKPHTFLWGKMVSAWLLVILLLVSSIPMWWMMAYLENYQWVGTLMALAIVIVTLLFVSSISLITTTFARTTAAATAIAYGIVSFVVFGTLTPLLMGESLSSQWRAAILAWNPFASGLQVVSGELLKGEAILWRPFIYQMLLSSLFCFAIAWFFLWKKLKRES